MPKLSPKTYLALGLSVLTTTLMLVLALLGVVPSQHGITREARASLAEAIAIASSTLLDAGQAKKLEAALRPIVERNPDLLSAAVQRSGGGALITIGDHDRHWDSSFGERSTDSQIQVPIWWGSEPWATVELRFAPILTPGWRGALGDPRLQHVGLVGLLSFPLFYFYLRKALRYLDPSQAVPAHVRAALDSLAEGLVIVDRAEQIALGNQAFAAHLGRHPDSLTGRSLRELSWCDPEGAPVPSGPFPWTRALEERSPQTQSVLQLRSQDTTYTFLVNSTPIFVGDGECGGALVSFDDVTQLEEHKTQLAAAKHEAEAASRAKSAFLANMSHEIRTPLNAILGFTEVLKRGYGRDRDPRTLLDTISSSGTHLLQLINDVLDLSKIESGRLDVERVRFDPHSLIEESIRGLSVKAREKGVPFELEVPGPLPETILSDPTRLRQILTNLLSNAIKFTSEGQVRVIARMTGETRLRVEVIDSGIGVAPEMTEAIFDPFVQADSSITRRFGGTGLGLPISRRFARLLGGDVLVQSDAGGSTFAVEIDPGPLEGVRMRELDEILASRSALPEEDWAQWEFPEARLLVVDDGEENRDLLRLVLEEVGLAVETAENGQIALERVAQTRFDAILMDMQMPVLDGFTATSRLRQHGFRSPVIAVTGSAMKGSETRCLTAGCDAYLIKPVNIDALLQTLAEFIGGKRVVGGGARAESGRRLGGGAGDRLPLRSRLSSKPQFQPIISRFTTRLDERLAEMESQLDRGDFAELGKLAHWLAGSAGTVGFDVFHEPARRLERRAQEESPEEVRALLGELRALAGRIERAGSDERPRETAEDA